MRKTFFCLLIVGFMLGCESESNQSPFTYRASDSAPIAVVNDLSKDFYTNGLSMAQYRQAYDWFLSSEVPDEVYQTKRNNPIEIQVYQRVQRLFPKAKIEKDLGRLFDQIHYYFPDFKNPKVFTFSSNAENALDPILYSPGDNLLVIDLSAFLGEKDPVLQPLEEYQRRTMSPEYLLSRVAEAIAREQLVPKSIRYSHFLDRMIYEGKIMTCIEAFLPDAQDWARMNYTPEQFAWASTNEENIWNFFVEKDILFSEDERMSQRFIEPGPFSKFYTEVDRRSSPRVGVFVGWKIINAWMAKTGNADLKTLLALPAEELFKQSEYQPK